MYNNEISGYIIYFSFINKVKEGNNDKLTYSFSC